MADTATSIHVLTEDGIAGPTIFKILVAHGLDTNLHVLSDAFDWHTIGPNDIVVVIVDQVAGSALERIPPDLMAALSQRIIVFLPKLDAKSVFALEKSGIKYITTSGQKIESLFFLISRIAPDCLRQAAEIRQYREKQSANIYENTAKLFEELRQDLGPIRIEAAKNTEKAMTGLMHVTPMAYWLDLIQSYHDGTAQHCSLVSGISLKFASRLGFGPHDRSRVFDSAFFHDIGKVRIPLAILDKPGALTPDERHVMKGHTRLGYEMLIQNEEMAGEIADAALSHHEYLDGSGYPNGLPAARIGDITRMLTICDIFAAMIERRPYKDPKSPEEAFSTLRSMGGKLDQDLVRVFEDVACECTGLDPATLHRMDSGARFS